MKLSILCYLASLCASPAMPVDTAEVEKRAPSFPIPYIGESLKDHSEQLISFLAAGFLGNKGVLQAVASIVPPLSIDFNCNFMKAISKTDDLPNYNTDFTSVEFIDDGRLKWLIEADGRTREDPVILYIHGGGFVFGIFPMMVAVWNDIWKQFNVKSDKLSVLALDYSIAPREATWPVPLQQTVSAYNELRKSSDNIIIAGDSAGGHLCLALLRHIKYPYDDVSEVATKPEGLIALSPATNANPNLGNGTKNGTYATYEGVDILDADIISNMGTTEVPDEELVNSPSICFFKDYVDWNNLLPDDKSKVFVSYGDNEVLKGDIETWLEIAELPGSGATIWRDRPGCESCLFQSGTHDNILFNLKDSTIFQPLANFLKDNFA